MVHEQQTEEVLNEDLECPDPALVVQRRHRMAQSVEVAWQLFAQTVAPMQTEGSQDGEEPDEQALVVKKWLLKRKEGKHLRQLIANPAAWNKGPGVTVTTSTRSLLSRRGKPTGSASYAGPQRCVEAGAQETPGTSEPGPSSRRHDSDEPQEDLDPQDASFQWRAILGWESDEDYEDEEPTSWPGFINDPTWSNVYESLMDMPENHVQQMMAALPETMRLIQQDLLAIVQQVSVDRGVQPPGRTKWPWHIHGVHSSGLREGGPRGRG